MTDEVVYIRFTQKGDVLSVQVAIEGILTTSTPFE